VALLADAQRAADGKQVLQREAASLPPIQKRYDIDAATLVAVFGVETDYGRVEGKYPVVDATLSRSCASPASKERRGQFFAALSLLQAGAVRPEEFRGSWAGAFGMTQFMPGTFVQHKADGDGDGAVDIYRSVPDALATTANFLSSLGWTDKLPWGVEVKVPEGAAQWNALERDHGCLMSGEAGGKCRSVAQWAAAGLKRVEGGALVEGKGKRLEAGTRAALLMPAGAGGPAWLVTRNYEAVWRYNRADAYALAINLLADALRGEPPMQAPWPTDDPGLSRAEFREVQGLLVQRGHADVSPDGHDGPLTQQAVKAEERARGWGETGRAGQKLLAALRRG
jgi:lytic murein transglycosylase